MRKQQRKRFEQGLQLIQEQAERPYTQTDICRKLDVLGHGISTSVFNRLVNGSHVGDRSIQKACTGLLLMIEAELGWKYDEEQEVFVRMPIETWVPKPIPIEPDEPKKPQHTGPILHFDGRRTIADKTKFMAEAHQEVVFFGVRLRQFSTYFMDRKDADFKDHIIRLMNRGVHFKCLVADPESNLTRAFFADRAATMPKEAYGEALIPQIIADLQNIKAELASLTQKGSFQIFTYRHIPSSHFLAVDLDTPLGKLLVSNYSYGIPRSKLPVIEVHKTDSPRLFALYQKSPRALMQDAREID